MRRGSLCTSLHPPPSQEPGGFKYSFLSQKSFSKILPFFVEKFPLTCSLVFTTSKGLTAAAEIDPAVMPATNDHLKDFMRKDKMYKKYAGCD